MFDLKRLLDSQKADTARFTQSLKDQVTLGSSGQMLTRGENPVRSQLSGIRTVIFVSRSMPERELLKLLEQGARHRDTVFLYRGWGRAGVDTAFAYAEALMRKLPESTRKNPPNIMVMPEAFRRYRISHVPALLHQDNGKWYLVQGVPSLDQALAAISSRRFGQQGRQWAVSEPDQAEIMKQAAARVDWKAQTRSAAESVSAYMAGSMDLPVSKGIENRLHIPYMRAEFDIRNPKTGMTVYPRGTIFNILATDPHNRRSVLAIDGRDIRQVRYAQRILRVRPQTLVLYTRLGKLAGAGIPASPLNKSLAQRLSIRTVPTYLQQEGMAFRVISAQPFD